MVLPCFASPLTSLYTKFLKCCFLWSQDMDRGTLSFAHNGVDLGVAFDVGLSGELFPAIAFYNRGQEVSLIPSAFDCPGAGLGISTKTLLSQPITAADGEASILSATRSYPEHASVMANVDDDDDNNDDGKFELKDVVEVNRIFGTSRQLDKLKHTPKACAQSRSQMQLKYPDPFVRRCWLQYRKWAAGHTFRAKTRLGVCMQFDISRQRCHAFGFQHGDRVATPRGQATVVGVAKHKLWFQIDGENGAWFFSSKELRSSKRLFVLLSRSKQHLASPKSPSSAKRASSSEPTSDDAAELESPSEISLAAFRAVLNHPYFAPQDDAVLVDLVNEYVSKCVILTDLSLRDVRGLLRGTVFLPRFGTVCVDCSDNSWLVLVALNTDFVLVMTAIHGMSRLM